MEDGELQARLDKARLLDPDFPHKFDELDPKQLAELVIPPKGDIRLLSLVHLRNWKQWKMLTKALAIDNDDPQLLLEEVLRSTVSVGAKGIDAVLRTGYAGLVPHERPSLRTRWRRWRGKE